MAAAMDASGNLTADLGKRKAVEVRWPKTFLGRLLLEGLKCQQGRLVSHWTALAAQRTNYNKIVRAN